MDYPQSWKNRLRILAASSASAIVSNSLGGDDYWKTQLPDSRRYCVPNGLPIEEINKTIPALPTGLATKAVPIVLYVGRLASDSGGSKNLKAFMEALKLINGKRKVFGVICGDGPQRSELEKLRHTLRLDSDVAFTGYLQATSVWALMKKASVFMSLSAYEGCPNTVMEAMMCSCPMVLSDIPAHREILADSDALFVDPCNNQQTCDSVIQTLDDRETAKNRAFLAKQKAQKWSVSRMARNYEKVYKEMV
jgi:glycosyltransferase involved in cell wall biosynthesis